MRTPFHTSVGLSAERTSSAADGASASGASRPSEPIRANGGQCAPTIVISRTEGELDLARLNAVLDGRMADAEEVQAPAGLVEDNPLPARHQA